MRDLAPTPTAPPEPARTPLPDKLLLRSKRPFWAVATRIYVSFAVIAGALLFAPRGPVFWGLIGLATLIFALFPALIQGLLGPLERAVLAATPKTAPGLLTALRQERRVRLFAPYAWTALQEGRLQLVRGEGRAAAKALTEAVRLAGAATDPPAAMVSAQAHALLLAEAPEQARELLQALAKRLAPGPWEQLHLAAAQLLAGGRVRSEEALALVDAAQAVLGALPRVLATRALLEQRVGASEAALAALQGAEAGLTEAAPDRLALVLVERARRMLRPAVRASEKRARKLEARAGKSGGEGSQAPVVKPAVVKPAVVKPAVAKPAVAKPAVAKPAVVKAESPLEAGGEEAGKPHGKRNARREERRAARRAAKLERRTTQRPTSPAARPVAKDRRVAGPAEAEVTPAGPAKQGRAAGGLSAAALEAAVAAKLAPGGVAAAVLSGAAGRGIAAPAVAAAAPAPSGVAAALLSEETSRGIAAEAVLSEETSRGGAAKPSLAGMTGQSGASAPAGAAAAVLSEETSRGGAGVAAVAGATASRLAEATPAAQSGSEATATPPAAVSPARETDKAPGIAGPPPRGLVPAGAPVTPRPGVPAPPSLDFKMRAPAAGAATSMPLRLPVRPAGPVAAPVASPPMPAALPKAAPPSASAPRAESAPTVTPPFAPASTSSPGVESAPTATPPLAPAFASAPMIAPPVAPRIGSAQMVAPTPAVSPILAPTSAAAPMIAPRIAPPPVAAPPAMATPMVVPSHGAAPMVAPSHSAAPPVAPVVQSAIPSADDAEWDSLLDALDDAPGPKPL